MEYIAYLLKSYLPWLFSGISSFAQIITCVRYRNREKLAYKVARIDGNIGKVPAFIRPLDLDDAEALFGFLNTLPDSHLKYFRPHEFDLHELQRVISSSAFMNYGLFCDGKLVAYAILKLTPIGSAFIGRLVSPELNGLGIGKYLATYLYWQALKVGVVPHSTISKNNLASLRSHQAVAEYEVVKSLPNDFLLIRFNTKTEHPPALNL